MFIFNQQRGAPVLSILNNVTLRLKLLHSLPQSLVMIHLKLIDVFLHRSIKCFLCDPPFRHFVDLFQKSPLCNNEV